MLAHQSHRNHLELVADNLSFPTSLTFDDLGRAYIAEAGLPFGGAPLGGRVWRLELDGSRSLLAEKLHVPVNGLIFHEGSLYISEGGHPGRISRLDSNGQITVILDNLPGPGNYHSNMHTNMAVFGPDGKLYFSQGAVTNNGVVGLDAYQLGWLSSQPYTCDIPGYDIRLAGVNFETTDPRSSDREARTFTGAFMPFGTSSTPGQWVKAELPCTAAVMRCNPDGSDLELVAWGLRNAYALGFLPDGRLLAVDQGADDRGGRPVGNIPDLLYEVQPGAWYGWPDFVGGDPITDPLYHPQRGTPPTFLLANHEQLPPPQRALLRFPPHVAAVKFDVAPASIPGWAGQIAIALFGDEAPMSAPLGPRVGRSVALVDPTDWSLHTIETDSLDRPIDVRFDPINKALYILDFGEFEVQAEHMSAESVAAVTGSGKLWRLPIEDMNQ